LKKQSQFAKGQNDVKSILTKSYGDFDGPGRRKNKPNSKPNKAKQSQFYLQKGAVGRKKEADLN